MPHIFCLSNIPYSCTNEIHLLILRSYSLLRHLHLSYKTIICSRFLHFPLLLGLMVPELEKARVTEIQVRMDCNGCVQKIRKALHGIQGIYEVYPDITQQKLTVVGWADPERIVKAIRKTRKVATICSHSEPTEAAVQPTEQPPEGGPPAPEAVNPPPSEAPPAEAAPQPQSQPEAAPPAEPPKDQPPPENPQPEPARAPAAATDANASGQQPPQPSGPKDVGDVHVICQHPPDCGHRYGYVHSYGGPWSRQYPNNKGNFYPEPLSRHPNSQVFHHEPPQPAFVTHSYNTYKPSPYVTEYKYVHSPPRSTHYSRIDHYNEDYHNNYISGSSSSSSHGNGNITSMFSDENPNACRIM
ncbi:Heavy metal-associated domain [Theobroma cacao]|uniref:Heavy metal transport/detoxification superfamily protein, putative n=1 Tax=Theobroma cacao TaxID=3641 RepID=A0A061EP42_THECC|nr:Heavy metal transport/detoxification superfamily protein, putative [Theobroma cacao]WRX20281.1 Heavy metal-associated domain [Theobroma cacao]